MSVSLVCSQLQAETPGSGSTHGWLSLRIGFIVLFRCRTLLGVSIKKVAPGETGGSTRLHLDEHRLPKHLSQQGILSLSAVLLGTGLQHMVLLGQALQ